MTLLSVTRPRILVIRRDNIGDLLCTTPLLSSLRQQWPNAHICVLANSYNAPILEGNPDIDEICAYEKAKHLPSGKSRLAAWGRTTMLLLRLRRKQFDLILCASPGARRLARILNARNIVEVNRTGHGHETEITSGLLDVMGVQHLPGPLVLKPRLSNTVLIRERHNIEKGVQPLVAIHLSARKPRQRWPEERFAALARRLLTEGLTSRILLFWAPGSESNNAHPGDDEKAARVIQTLSGLPINPVPTQELGDLVAGLSLADIVICSDGGAMHIAAALGKPILCFFGNSSAERWHPWRVPYALLQKPSRDVSDISVEEAFEAFQHLTATN